ncbi:MAG: hypothetical protein ABIQ35_07615 [Verrucomicrobiota bacterium]
MITTLLTPYLIQSADALVSWFDRVAPKPLTDKLEVYTSWEGRLGSQRHTSIATNLMLRWMSQMALNAASTLFPGFSFQ